MIYIRILYDLYPLKNEEKYKNPAESMVHFTNIIFLVAVNPGAVSV
jgi:hypothetical protein